MIVEDALARAEKNTTVRIGYVPLRDMDDLSKRAGTSRPVPGSWGCTHGMDYFHGIDKLFHLDSIREEGLRLCPAGAGSWTEPALYTCKNRRTPFWSYATGG